MVVNLLQYLLPTGERKFYEIDIDDRCQEKYKQIISSGYWLFVERNHIGFVLQYIENELQTVDISASRGGYWENKKALEKMIMNFDPLKISHYENINTRNMHAIENVLCVQCAGS